MKQNVVWKLEGTAQFTKSLLYDYMILSWIPKAHVKDWVIPALVIPALGMQRQSNPWALLASQPSIIGEQNQDCHTKLGD